MHNHPSGESTPSDADIKVTRDLIRAGQLLKMELINHVIIGSGNFSIQQLLKIHKFHCVPSSEARRFKCAYGGRCCKFNVARW